MRLYERSLTGAGKPGCSPKEAPCVQTAPKAPPWANPSAACASLSPIIQPHLVDEVVVVVAVAIVAQLHSMLALMLPLSLSGVMPLIVNAAGASCLGSVVGLLRFSVLLQAPAGFAYEGFHRVAFKHLNNQKKVWNIHYCNFPCTKR